MTNQRVCIPIEDAAELLQAYDAWKGNIPWDIDEGESQRKHMERFEKLRSNLVKKGFYEEEE